MAPSQRLLRTVVVASLVLGACGSDDPSTSGNSNDDAGPTTTRVGQAEDTAAAEAALLQLSDFPPGWSETPTDHEDDETADVSECTGADHGKLIDIGDAAAETGTFHSPGEDLAVDNSVGLAATVDDAQEGIAVLQDDDTLRCLQSMFGEYFQDRIDNPPEPSDSLPPGASIGAITVAHLNLTSVGDDMAAIRVTIPISFEGFEVTAYFDAVLVRRGRTLSGLTFESFIDPFPVEEVERITGLSAQRLPAS